MHSSQLFCTVHAGESQACATAAKDRIEALEQEAEAATTEHQQALEAATQALREAQEAAMKQLQEAQDAASAQAQQVADAHVAEVAKVQAELNAVKVRSIHRSPGPAYADMHHCVQWAHRGLGQGFGLGCQRLSSSSRCGTSHPEEPSMFTCISH